MTGSTPAKPTVLIVDDDTAVGNLCAAMLRQGGFETLVTGGSSEALKLCKQHQGPIDLLLTDLVLPPPAFQLASSANEFPHVHGHELAIRALRMREGLRILVMSGNPDQELAGYGIKRDNFPFVTKPVDMKEFLQTVRDILQTAPPKLSDIADLTPSGDVTWYD